MSGFKVVLASGAEHLRERFNELGFQVFSCDTNFDEKRFFPNSDLYVKIAQVEELTNQRVVVIQSCTGSSPAAREYFSTSDRVQELILILDLLRHPCKVEKIAHKKYKTSSLVPPSRIEVVLTFQPFALQDKAFSTGEAVSSRCAMRSIANLCDRLCVVEPVVNRNLPWAEELAKQGKYEMISIMPELIDQASFMFGFEEYILTAPDEGAQKRFGVSGFSKRRSDSFTIEMKGELDVTGKNVIVIDDLTKSGTTLLEAADMLRDQGAADVGLVVQHVTPIRHNGEKLLEELISKSDGKVFTSNTVHTVTFIEKHPELAYNIVDKLVEYLQ
ncbi:MAG: phosphoribosyltransferase family protein [Candidatus Hodarchaeota archaeon]